ncbi:MAG: hypothetical protein MJ231_01120 [bacterium]|nr:hypothetical protein [bacterium]
MQGYDIKSLSAKTQQLIKDKNLDVNQDGLINQDNGELATLLSTTGKNDINDLCYDSWLGAKKLDLLCGGLCIGAGLNRGIHTAHDRFSSLNKDTLKEEARKLFKKYNGVKPEMLSLDIPYEAPNLVSENELSFYQYLKERGGEQEVKEISEFRKQRELESKANYDKRYKKMIEEIKEHNKKVKEWKPKVSMKECLQKALKIQRKTAILGGVAGVLGTAATCLGIYLIACKPEKGIAKLTGTNDYTPVEKQRSEYEEQYIQVFGEEQELNEYTPQKGEYWTAILKAKYGVDDATALRMAHRIKEVIYGDSTAAKQSPVMYLPQTWIFEGNTYKYNDSAKVETTSEFSDDVKTEKGKMDKDLQY